jgi:flagellar motor switch protein FliN
MEELDITKEQNTIKDQKFFLENMRVNIGIEIGRLPMTLKEICTLKEGQILDLHRSIDEPLEMVVEDKTIGYCQPVNIEGKLGIRIIKMLT